MAVRRANHYTKQVVTLLLYLHFYPFISLFRTNYFFHVPLLLIKKIKIKSVVLQLRRANTDRSGCYQMAVQEVLWLAKRYTSTLILV